MKLAFVNMGCKTVYKYASKSAGAVGGAERQQWLLARALAVNGWSVSVAVPDELPFGTRKVIDKVEFVGLGQSHGHVVFGWYRFLAAERPLWSYWRCASHLLAPAIAAAKLVGVRSIFSAALDSDINPRHALYERRNWWPLYAWGLSQSDRILVQHGGQFEKLAVNLRSKSYVVPNIAGEAEKIQSCSNRNNYVAWVGQLRQHKRPDLLIELARRLPHVQFVVCGGPGPTPSMSPVGYNEQILQTFHALPNVDYRGQVAPDQAARIISESAILLCTSDTEGFPNTFLQAWSTGTPVVSLNVDPDRVIEEKKLGKVVTNTQDGALAIEMLMGSPVLRNEISVRARKHVADGHSAEVAVAAFERAIRGFRVQKPRDDYPCRAIVH